MGYLPRKERELFDARTIGAKCDECPLNGCNPIKPVINKSAKMVVLGEAPGPTEEQEGAVFVGSAGEFLNRALEAVEIPRSSLHLTHTVLCRPKAKLTPAEWSQAVKACQGRLKKEIDQTRTRWCLALGVRALQTLSGKKKITPWVGSPQKGLAPPLTKKGVVKKGQEREDFSEWSFIASFHPNFLFQAKGNAYIPVFRIFLGRAWAFATGEQDEWTWPKLVINPPYAPYLNELAKCPEVSVDIENRPSNGHIRCIGVGTGDLAVSVPINEGVTSPSDHKALSVLLANKSVKIFHNAQHDLLALTKHGYMVNGPVFDTLLAHAVVAPQIAHNLSMACAIEFHAENWKSLFHVEGDDKGKKGKNVRFERAPLPELQKYNCKDNVMQFLLKQRLAGRLAQTHNGQALYDQYMACATVGLQMREDGVLVDRTKFLHHEKVFRRRRSDAAWQLRLIAKAVKKENWEIFKLGSSKELHDLFFEKLHVQKAFFSETSGRAQLNEKALNPLLTSGNPLHANAARSLLGVRKYQKLLRTYIQGMAVSSASSTHPVWKVYGTVTGRWSSADPNLQNIPKPKVKKLKNGTKKIIVPGLRDLFAARSGKYFVEADYSQLELRIVALLAGDELLLKWYAEKLDVHTFNAKDLFGVETPTKEQRDLAKTFVYAVNYGADATTVWQKIVIDFPNTSLALVERLKSRWFQKHHWIKRWQDNELRKARSLGYVEAPISGRREHFHAGRIDASKVLNFPVQATGADVINPAVPLIARDLPRALRMQVHDALVCEVKKADIPKAMKIMRKHMEAPVTLNGITCTFPVDFKIGRNWGHCVEVKNDSELANVLRAA